MIVVLSPRSFGERDALLRWLAVEVLGRRCDTDVGLGELAQNEAEPIDALEPPVTEELAVKGHREERVAAVSASTG